MPDRNVILILTEQFDPHADIMVTTLQNRHPDLEVVRFHPDLFPVSAGLTVEKSNGQLAVWLHFFDRTVDLTRTRSIWFRRPGRPVLHPQLAQAYRDWSMAEAEMALQGAWYSLGALLVNPPWLNRVASNKLYQLVVADQLGFTIAPTLVSNRPEVALAFHERQGGDLIMKPLSRAMVVKGGVKDTHFLYTETVPRAALEGEGGQQIRHVPVQLQPRVRKECEVRVTVVGEQCFAAALRSPSDRVDIRRWDETNPEYSVYQLPEPVAQGCAALVQQLGLHYGAIDLLHTSEGEYVFLEINPSGQFYWIEQQTGLPIMAALADLLAAGAGKGTVACSPA